MKKMLLTISMYYKYDILVVSFPFSTQSSQKARPVVVISNDAFNSSKRGDLLVMAISGSIKNKLDFEPEIKEWEQSGLLKPSILKAAIATIDQNVIIQKLGKLQTTDQQELEKLVQFVLS